MIVFSDDKTLGGVTFQLKIIVTVVGDTIFDNTAFVTIKYIASPFAHPFELTTEKPPRFNSKSNSKKTLPLVEDETGAQIFSPIVMLCPLEWDSALPAIIGEDEVKKFTVDVNLGDASKFLSYNKFTRNFEKVPWQNILETEVFIIKIEIVN